MAGGAARWPGLVFVHGFADSSKTWEHQLAAFGDRTATAAFDLPGHVPPGGSPAPGTPTRAGAIARLDEVVADVRAATGAAIVIVGHSLGGYLAMCRVARDSSGVAALVLVASGPGFRNDERRREWNESLREIAESMGLPPEAAAVAEQPDAWLMNHVADIAVPALLVVGEEDVTYHGGMRYLEERLPAAEPLVVVPGGRHHVHRTHPVAVNAAIEAFLTRLGS